MSCIQSFDYRLIYTHMHKLVCVQPLAAVCYYPPSTVNTQHRTPILFQKHWSFISIFIILSSESTSRFISSSVS